MAPPPITHKQHSAETKRIEEGTPAINPVSTAALKATLQSTGSARGACPETGIAGGWRLPGVPGGMAGVPPASVEPAFTRICGAPQEGQKAVPSSSIAPQR